MKATLIRSYALQFAKAYVRASKCFSQRGLLFEAKKELNTILERDAACAEASKEMEILDSVEGDITKATEYLNSSDFERASYYVDRILPVCSDAPLVLTMRCVQSVPSNVQNFGTSMFLTGTLSGRCKACRCQEVRHAVDFRSVMLCMCSAALGTTANACFRRC